MRGLKPYAFHQDRVTDDLVAAMAALGRRVADAEQVLTLTRAQLMAAQRRDKHGLDERTAEARRTAALVEAHVHAVERRLDGVQGVAIEALGTQEMPSNQILIGLAMFLTMFIMAPVGEQINRLAVEPAMAGKLSVGDAIKAIKGLKEAHDIRVIVSYEETHKDRANVVSAAQTQLASLAKEAVGVDA